jgi:hypothetical protein
MGETQSDAARLALLVSGDSELGRSRAAWLEADRVVKQIAADGGVVQVPSEVRAWLCDEPLEEEELERLLFRPLHRAALPSRVRGWLDGTLYELAERRGEEMRKPIESKKRSWWRR